MPHVPDCSPARAAPYDALSPHTAQPPTHLAPQVADRPAAHKRDAAQKGRRPPAAAFNTPYHVLEQRAAARVDSDARPSIARQASVHNERAQRQAVINDELEAALEARNTEIDSEVRAKFEDQLRERVMRQVTARFDDIPLSVKKLNMVAKLVRRLHVDDAIVQLALLNKKLAARHILKVRFPSMKPHVLFHHAAQSSVQPCVGAATISGWLPLCRTTSLLSDITSSAAVALDLPMPRGSYAIPAHAAAGRAGGARQGARQAGKVRAHAGPRAAAGAGAPCC